MEEITVLVDFDRIPVGIGVWRENGKRLYSEDDLGKIITWMSNQLPTISPDKDAKIILHITGDLQSWMTLGIGLAIESWANEIYYCPENSAIVRLK